jgi:pimeloyl-ACP methyl ester carboxylesterase
VDFRESSVAVRGLRLRVRERGQGPACILLHGWLDHRGSFDRLAPLLPGRTVAYDHRGHGDSSWAGAGGFYHLAEYVGDLDGLLHELGIEGPLRLVGHSMGASLSLVYAAARPERVAHVTMLDGAPFVVEPKDVPPRLTTWLDDLRMNRSRRTVGSIDDARARLQRFSHELSSDAAQVLAEGGVSTDPEQGGAWAWKWDPLLRAHSPLPFTEAVLQEVVRCVRAPVLLLRAERGLLPEEADLRARFASLQRLSVETLPGASHHLHLELPGPVADRIRRAWAAAGIVL